MQHGQRAAYYVRHYLEGTRDPLPYRTPNRTCRVPVAQDLMREKPPLPSVWPDWRASVRCGAGPDAGEASPPGAGVLRTGRAPGQRDRHGTFGEEVRKEGSRVPVRIV